MILNIIKSERCLILLFETIQQSLLIAMKIYHNAINCINFIYNNDDDDDDNNNNDNDDDDDNNNDNDNDDDDDIRVAPMMIVKKMVILVRTKDISIPGATSR